MLQNALRSPADRTDPDPDSQPLHVGVARSFSLLLGGKRTGDGVQAREFLCHLHKLPPESVAGSKDADTLEWTVQDVGTEAQYEHTGSCDLHTQQRAQPDDGRVHPRRVR